MLSDALGVAGPWPAAVAVSAPAHLSDDRAVARAVLPSGPTSTARDATRTA